MTILHIIIQFAGFALQAVPVSILSLVPFDDDMLPMPRRRLTSLYAGGMLLLSFGFALVSYFNYFAGIDTGDVQRLAANMYMTACIIIWIVGLFTTVRCTFQKKLLVIMMMLYYAATILVILNFLDIFFRRFMSAPQYGSYAAYDIASLVVMQLITAPLVALFLKRKVRYSLTHMESSMLRRSNLYVSIALLIFFISVFAIQTFMDEVLRTTPIILCFVGFILTDGILYFVLFSEIQLTAQTRELENMLRGFDSRYSRISASIEEARRARHDIRHHLNHISQMNHRGDTEALAAYLESYEASFREIESASLYGYPAFDNILQYYIETAGDHGIKVSTELHPINESLSFDIIDITVFLGNLMENAINACRDLPEGSPRFINIWVKQAGQAFLIKIENSCDTENEQPDFTDSPAFAQSRSLGHGHGLRSVRFAAEKYGGNAEFKKTAGVFTARVVLNIP